MKHAWLILATTLLLACAPDSADEQEAPVVASSPAPVGSGASGWQSIEPGGETACSDGSSYRFFVRQGDPERLLVYFQGGGACWAADNCDPQGNPSHKPTVGADEIQRYHGIFALDHVENPFREHSIVVAPYCTGDVHLGRHVAEYALAATAERPEHTLTVHHVGLANAESVLAWIAAELPAPASVFVTGSSAGAIPSPYYAWRLAEQFPSARIAQLGDGAGGYRQQNDQAGILMERWRTLEHLARYPEFADMAPDAFNFESLYVAAGERFPKIAFSQFDNAEDSVQKRFLAMSGGETDSLKTLIESNQADIRSRIENFSSFIAGGEAHTILARPEFYELQVGGVRIRDWVADLAEFKPVADLACSDCSHAEVIPRED